MMKWPWRSATPPTLAADHIARRLDTHLILHPGYCGLRPGQARIAAGGQLQPGDWLLAPGPHTLQFPLLAAWPECGVSLQICASTPDPRLPQQRLELYLQEFARQYGPHLSLSHLQSQIAQSVQNACARGRIRLSSCPDAHEWQSARSELEKLLYLRFGWLVENCLPCALQPGEAQALALLQAADHAQAAANAAPAAPPEAPAALPPTATALAQRLFLELPALAHSWRAQTLFGAAHAQRQQLLRQASLLEALAALPPRQEAGAAPSSAHAQAWQALDACWETLAHARHDDSASQHSALQAWQTMLTQSEAALRPTEARRAGGDWR
ncbi:hypothetical protein V8J88_15210 [Massilia sp. W12]|uniref:hypothetical protein n=1 Tax=Massilia sp. W12 TaxID=3126507 RepID=UPI0030D5E20E